MIQRIDYGNSKFNINKFTKEARKFSSIHLEVNGLLNHSNRMIQVEVTEHLVETILDFNDWLKQLESAWLNNELSLEQTQFLFKQQDHVIEDLDYKVLYISSLLRGHNHVLPIQRLQQSFEEMEANYDSFNQKLMATHTYH